MPSGQTISKNKIMSFIDNIIPFKIAQLDGFVKVLVQDQQVGWTPLTFANQISALNDTWSLTDRGLEMNDRLKTFDERTQAADECFLALSEKGVLPHMPDYASMGGIDWVSVCAHDNPDEPLFILKRFYHPCLGIRINAVMLNGYKGDQYWVAIRSMNVEGPGKLDVISAGMVRHGETIAEGLQHEAEEEAGLSEDDIKDVKKVGILHLPTIGYAGFFSDERFHIFDIELLNKEPVVMLPYEVSGFKLLSMNDVISKIETGESFKAHINVVVTDFLVRHGYLNDHPEFAAIKTLVQSEPHVTANRP